MFGISEEIWKLLIKFCLIGYGGIFLLALGTSLMIAITVFGAYRDIFKK